MVEGSHHVPVTRGAGYIGSRLRGTLLRLGYRVTVLDTLLFGGESLLVLLPYFTKRPI
jgi:UDP-glucose 4-epimerase